MNFKEESERCDKHKYLLYPNHWLIHLIEIWLYVKHLIQNSQIVYLFIYTYLNYLNVLSIEIMVAPHRRRSQAHRRRTPTPMSFPSTMSTARLRTKAAMLRGAKMGFLQWTKLTLILLKFVGNEIWPADSCFFSCWEWKKKQQKIPGSCQEPQIFHGMSEGFLNAWMKEESVEYIIIIVPFFGKLDSLGVVFKKRRLMQVEIHEATISYNLPQINKSLSVQLWGGVPRKVIKC